MEKILQFFSTNLAKGARIEIRDFGTFSTKTRESRIGRNPSSGEKIEIKDFLSPFEKLMNSTRKGLSLQRYKGLGEMNPEQLWDTTMNPVGRRLVQVKIEDADEASDLFEQLMGDNVENRREFIETNASLIGSIDI